jgi:exopolysaccharide biosynthesis polyprenyl glycosylphosphotransferase
VALSSHAIGGRWLQILYGLIDSCLICANSIFVFLLRWLPFSPGTVIHLSQWGLSADLSLSQYGAFLLLYAVLIVLFCQSHDLYRTPRERSALIESFAVLKAVFFATLLLSAFIYILGAKDISRIVVGFSGLLNATTLVAWRLWKRTLVLSRVARGIGTRNALIIGAGKIGQALSRTLEENKLLGYSFKGFLDGNHSTDPRLLGKIEDLSRIARAQFIDVVFVTIPSERELVKRVALEARQNRLNVKVVPELYDGLGWEAPLHYVGQFPVMELHREPIPALGLLVKRGIDIVLSGAGLLVLSPFLAAIALLIKLDSSGPILYGSRRVGKKGRIFTCYKFRTMVPDADELKDGLRHLNVRNGPFFKILDDPRITRVGKFLREFSVDEFPQLWNVLKGEMSLVGPRPHPVDDFEQYSLEHLRRLDVKPGVTCLWQVYARKDPSFETNMALDLEYIENWSPRLDLMILLRTIPEVLKGSGQ